MSHIGLLRRRGRALMRAFGLMSVMITAAHAQDAATETATKEIGLVEGEITQSTSKQADIIRSLATALKDREVASARLVELASVAAQQERQVETIQQNIATLNQDNAQAMLKLAQRREDMGNLLAGLQKLSRNPPPALVVSPQDATKALRGAMVFSAIIPRLREEAEQIKLALASVEAIRQDLEAKREGLREATLALSATRASIARTIDERQAAATMNAKALQVERAKAEELAKKAKDLRALVAGIEKKRAEDQLALEDLIRNSPDFSALKGQLAMPVQGAIKTGFGAELDTGKLLQGQYITSFEGSQVISPVPGHIEFAGEYLNYGKMVIVNPGHRYLILLAGLHTINVEIGQSVRALEPLGDMAFQPPALAENVNNSSLTNQGVPMLYVEFRHRNEPVDPSPWWVHSDQNRQARIGTE